MPARNNYLSFVVCSEGAKNYNPISVFMAPDKTFFFKTKHMDFFLTFNVVVLMRSTSLSICFSWKKKKIFIYYFLLSRSMNIVYPFPRPCVYGVGWGGERRVGEEDILFSRCISVHLSIRPFFFQLHTSPKSLLACVGI